ncbi:unnamed protein product [Sphagnum balticum]
MSSIAPPLLLPTDYIISTLGNFRLSLLANSCQLKIENFNNGGYGIVGTYPTTAGPPCASLLITNNALTSNSNSTLLSLTKQQAQLNYDETYLTIDEMGIIRLTAVSKSNQFQTAEDWISIFRSPQQYLYSISNIAVSLDNSLSIIQNNGGWGFSASRGVFRIFRLNNVSKIVRYNYSAFSLTPNNIYDAKSNTLPNANFKKFRF